MAEAKKCDLCGECFDPLEMKESERIIRFRNPIIQTRKGLEDNTCDYLTMRSPDSWVDLCPECARNFLWFMDGEPLAVNTDDSFTKEDFMRLEDDLKKAQKEASEYKEKYELSQKNVNKLYGHALDGARSRNDFTFLQTKYDEAVARCEALEEDKRVLSESSKFWKAKYDKVVEEKETIEEDVNYHNIKYGEALNEALNESNTLFEYLLKVCCGEDVSSDNLDSMDIYKMKKKLMKEANLYDPSNKVSCCDILRDVFLDAPSEPFARDGGGDTDGDVEPLHYCDPAEWPERSEEDELY